MSLSRRHVVQVLNWGALTVGTLLGGGIADALGLSAIVALAAGPPFLALCWMWSSPVRRLHELPMYISHKLV